MIHFSKIVSSFILVTVLFLIPQAVVFSQDNTFSVTVTPSIYNLKIGKGETWRSVVEVINHNNFNITVFAFPLQYERTIERGKESFTPLIGDIGRAHEDSLAQWIGVDSSPVHIRANSKVAIPFSITVPNNALPGEHFSAIALGSEPLAKTASSGSVSISSLVVSLVRTRIEGEVNESGIIREFSTKKLFYTNPEVSFNLRFENRGNVYLVPFGEITLYNMWGKERGNIALDQGTFTTRIAPDESIERSFSWTGEHNTWDVGVFKAVAKLNYGGEYEEQVTQKVYFWIVPLISVLFILGSFSFFILFIVWAVRAYIRKALSIESKGLPNAVNYGVKKINSKLLYSPFVQGAIDLRKISYTDVGNHTVGNAITIGQFTKKYKAFFIFIVILIALVYVASVYFRAVFLEKRNFNINITSNQESHIKVSQM